MSSPIDQGVVLVTGASSGIGLAMARELAARARLLVLVARRAERLEALAVELRAAQPRCEVLVRAADVADAAAMEAILGELEARGAPLDVLINNAGLGDVGLFEKSEPAKNQQMILVNTLALTAWTRRALPGMVSRGRGAVLMVSSGFGLTWLPGFAVYVGTKNYVSAFAESLSAELAGTGVRVTHVCPGPVRTEFNEVAGVGEEMAVPGFVSISAEQCAREAIAAVDAGRVLCVPGWVMWAVISMGRLTPWWVLRPLYRVLARVARRRLWGG